MKRLIYTMYLVALALSASAATWYVRVDGDDREDGRSWEAAQATLRLGIDNCHAGDTLFVEVGTYHEAIVLKDGITVIGGCTAEGRYNRDRRLHSIRTIRQAQT